MGLLKKYYFQIKFFLRIQCFIYTKPFVSIQNPITSKILFDTLPISGDPW